MSQAERLLYPTITCVDCGLRGDLRSVYRLEGDMGRCRWPNSCQLRQQRLPTDGAEPHWALKVEEE